LKDQAQESYISKTFTERNNKVFLYIGSFILMAASLAVGILILMFFLEVLAMYY